ncbi:MAG: flagellar basal body rod protein FlgC [Thermodesulfovibrio sp.]|nr:flagellar basal body rod protein FlgC [Thermodesulfovibrio sp.]
MDWFGVFRVSSSALEAQRTRMNSIASNMANAHSTRTLEGGPYRRKDVVFSTKEVETGEKGLEGVQVSQIVEDRTPPTMVYDPGHPDADKNGYVAMPNVNVIEEMTNMMMATRAYEASVAAFNMSKGMVTKSFEIGR